jgi:ribosomal protein S18 acetylase RimI-like enzyme
LLRARGGKKAAAFWLLRKVTGFDVYVIFGLDLSGSPLDVEALPPGVELRVFDRLVEIGAVDPQLLATLDAHTGCGVAEVIRRGGRVFALAQGDRVLSQLRIDTRAVEVDTPIDMRLQLRPGVAFLSFLHTDPAARQGGWARRLIGQVCARLQREGRAACCCHVQATNVRSLNTFRRAGWSPRARLVANGGGRLLSRRCAPASPIAGIEELRPA